jgi:hypothetical protein
MIPPSHTPSATENLQPRTRPPTVCLLFNRSTMQARFGDSDIIVSTPFGSSPENSAISCCYRSNFSVVHTLYLIYKLVTALRMFLSNCFSYLPIQPTSIHRETTFIVADWLSIFRRTITATPCLATFVPTRYAGLLHKGEGDRRGIERY